MLLLPRHSSQRHEFPSPLNWFTEEFCCSFPLFMASANVSVISSSPQIVYQPSGSWTRIPDPDGFDAGGSHMLTSNPDASATITYNFSFFYFYAPRWPYQVKCQIMTDNASSIVDLQDHNVPDLGVDSSASPTVKSSLAFKGGTGEFGTHIIRISVPSGTEFAVVDMIVFETTTNANNSTSGVSTVDIPLSTTSTSASAVPSSTSKSVVSWVVLAVGPIAFLLTTFMIIAFLIWRSKRKRKRATTAMREPVDPGFTSPSFVSTDPLRTTQSSNFSRIDSSERESVVVNSFGHRHVYHHHSPSASISETPNPQPRNPVTPLTNVRDYSSITPFMTSSTVGAPSQTRHTEDSTGFHVANTTSHDVETELSTSSPPSYSFAVASANTLFVRDKK